MENIHFSTAESDYFKDGKHYLAEILSPTVANSDIHLFIEPVPWLRLWHFIQTKTIDRTGLDLSELGTTWIDSLTETNVLHQFTKAEIDSLGGRDSFFEAVWRGALGGEDGRIISIPWMTDTRLIYYHRDILDSARISESTAFSTTEALCDTLMTLASHGSPAWGAPTFGCNNTIHHAASWIWAKGGDFISADKKKTTFCEDAAIQGLAEYYSLFGYMPHPFDSFETILNSFKENRVAAVLDGPWLYAQLIRDPNFDVSKIGITLPPGPPFLGGSNLVVWKQSDESRIEKIHKLIHRLTAPAIQPHLTESFGLLPARQASGVGGRYQLLCDSDAVRAAMVKGRHLPKTRLWAPLESSLSQALGLVWQTVKTSPNRAITDVLRRHLEPLAKRFDRMMELF